MLIRINKEENVLAWADPAGLGQRLRARDVFLINTRYETMDPEDAVEITEMIRTAFPCNRVVTLNGLGADPNLPGYALTLIDRAELWAVMLDWEKADWALARLTNPEMTAWKGRFGRSLHRLRSWMDVLTAAMALTPSAPAGSASPACSSPGPRSPGPRGSRCCPRGRSPPPGRC
jgi:hypothetical protein